MWTVTFLLSPAGIENAASPIATSCRCSRTRLARCTVTIRVSVIFAVPEQFDDMQETRTVTRLSRARFLPPMIRMAGMRIDDPPPGEVDG